MNNHPIKDMMGVTMEKIKEMVDVNTIIGEPIVIADGTTIIPISKVSFGFASGVQTYPLRLKNYSVVVQSWCIYSTHCF